MVLKRTKIHKQVPTARNIHIIFHDQPAYERDTK